MPGSLELVREYWEERVHDWGAAESPPGTLAFFQEIEGYRFRKLGYLDDLLRWLVAAGDMRGRKILDIGCGVGTELSRMSRLREGSELYGVDLTSRAVRLAEENFRLRGLMGDFQIMNGENLKFPDHTFDAVFCHSTLQFTPHPEKMVEQIRRVLKPGGRSVLMAVNRNSWLSLICRLSGQRVDFQDAPFFHRHSRSQFAQLLSPCTGAEVTVERLPGPSEALSGWKGFVFNRLFVPFFGLFPTALVRSLGHHHVARWVKE